MDGSLPPGAPDLSTESNTEQAEAAFLAIVDKGTIGVKAATAGTLTPEGRSD